MTARRSKAPPVELVDDLSADELEALALIVRSLGDDGERVLLERRFPIHYAPKRTNEATGT